MFKKLLLLFLFLIITTPVQAVSWPPEVKPEQGKASGTIGIGNELLTVNIGFWNVGEVGGSQYAEATIDIGCTQKTIGDWKCTADDNPPQVGTFSGGPNGKITVNGNTIQLVKGINFTSDLEKSFQAKVENPEIFSKYRWSMDESVPIPKIGGDKYSVETYGSARFNDLYGQVEVNIPNPDGTYDEEAWNFAKIDMELPPGTRIKVSEKSGLMLTFPDIQTNIIVGPDTEIVLVSGAPQKSAIQMLWGNLKANVQKMMKDGTMEIEMSQAVAGIKGTQFILNETKKESSVKVIEGAVKFTSKVTGKSVDVGKGESVLASSKGLSEKTTFDIAGENKKWDSRGNETRIRSLYSNSGFWWGLVLGAGCILGILIMLKNRPAGIILLLFSVGCGIYIFVIRQSMPKDKADITNSQTPSSSIPTVVPLTVTATPTTTAKLKKATEVWKTNSDKQLGITFRHPDNIKPETFKDGTLALSLWGPTQKEDTEFIDGVHISVVKKPLAGRTLSAIVEEERKGSEEIAGGKIAQAKSVTLGGVSGLSYGAMDNIYYFLPVAAGSYLEILNLSADPGNLGYLDTADKILNSLQIL